MAVKFPLNAANNIGVLPALSFVDNKSIKLISFSFSLLKLRGDSSTSYVDFSSNDKAFEFILLWLFLPWSLLLELSEPSFKEDLSLNFSDNLLHVEMNKEE